MRKIKEDWRRAVDAASIVPGPIGMGASAIAAADDIRKGEYGSALLNVAGMVPGVKQAQTVYKGARALGAGVARSADIADTATKAYNTVRTYAKVASDATSAKDAMTGTGDSKPNVPSSGRSINQYEKDKNLSTVKEQYGRNKNPVPVLKTIKKIVKAAREKKVYK